MMKYLRKAPTLIVIGVVGYVGWPILSAERDLGPPKPMTKPPVTAKPRTIAALVSLRDPFQVDRPPATITNPTPTPTSAPAVIPLAGSSATLASLKSSSRKGDLAELSADEDRILAGMKLDGTFIDDREKLAVIDNRVYARGDQLRRANGDLLPYVVIEVRKDRALVRRGRRDFVIAFSDVPSAAGPKVNAPATPAQSKAIARTETEPNPLTAANANSPGAKRQPPSNPAGPKEMILQLLSRLGAQSAGIPPGAGLGAVGGLNPNTLGAGINQNSISAGLDALMGKSDNIGRAGDRSTPSDPGGGATP